MSTIQDAPTGLAAADYVSHLSEDQFDELTDALVEALEDALGFLSDAYPGATKH